LTPDLFAALEALWYYLSGLGYNFKNAYKLGASISGLALWNLNFMGSSGLDLFNSGFEELNAWMNVIPLYDNAGGGSSAAGDGNQITRSNYDPHNTDLKYREDAIIAAMKNFGVNVNRKDISYEPGAVDYGGVYHNTGKIYIGPSAFEKSFDFLGAIIGHERVHYYQYKQAIIPPVNTMWDAATEVVAEDWVLRNIENGRFSLNIDEK